MPLRDYYFMLGVSRTEPPAGIRRAFRELAQRYHPDRAGEQFTAVFRDLVEAYRVLSDPQTRGAYDAGLRHGGVVFHGESSQRPSASPRGNALALRAPLEGFWTAPPRAREILRRILERSPPPSAPAEAPSPVDVELLLSSSEAATGGRLALQVPVFYPCAACRASGRDGPFPCAECGGWRMVQHDIPVEVSIPSGVPDGAVFELPLRGLGLHNLYVRVRTRVAVWSSAPRA